MTCLVKLAMIPVLLLALVVGLFYLGLPQKLASGAIVGSLERRQGLKATLGELAITGVDRVELRDLSVLDVQTNEPAMQLKKIEAVFSLGRLGEGVRAAREVVIDGGVIKADKVRAVAAARKRAQATAPEAPPSSPLPAPSPPPASAAADAPPRTVVFRHLSLDAGEKRIGIAFLKTTVSMVVEDVEGELELAGSKVQLKRLTGTFHGVKLPVLTGVTLDTDALADPEQLRGVPSELRAVLVAIGLLLGGQRK